MAYFRLQHERDEQHINQKKFAAQTGISTHTLRFIENGRLQPTAEELAKMSAVLGIAPELLMVPVKIVFEEPKPIPEYRAAEEHV